MKGAYKKYFTFILVVMSLLICSTDSIAGVDLPWSTSFNAGWSEWTGSAGQNPPNSDGLTHFGDSAASNVHWMQITSAANFSGGNGGLGQRNWFGDGQDNCSGGLYVAFTSSQSELWIRWYIRYQSGFKWSSIGYHKLLYFNNVCIPELQGWDSVNIFAGGANHSSSGGGWDTMYANGAIDGATGHRISDGSWHCMEIHLKVSGGIAEYWLDGVKYLSVSGINYGSNLASFHFLSNQMSTNNGSDMYIDVDDIALSNTGYIGPIGKVSTSGPPATPTKLIMN